MTIAYATWDTSGTKKGSSVVLSNGNLTAISGVDYVYDAQPIRAAGAY